MSNRAKNINIPFGTSRRDMFCWKCKTINCSNHSHPRFAINSKTRIPKLKASKSSIKNFLLHLSDFVYYRKVLKDLGINDLEEFINKNHKNNK